MNLEEKFTYAQLFSVHIVDDYFVDIIQYLSTGTAPQEYTAMQKKKLAVDTTDYQLISRHLYKMGTYSIL
jgi:hypothetical protein